MLWGQKMRCFEFQGIQFKKRVDDSLAFLISKKTLYMGFVIKCL